MPERRFFAAIWDWMISSSEKAGLSDMRAEVVGQAAGRTLELGAGTGNNFPHYTSAVIELVASEPDPHMARRLREHLAERSPAIASVEVVEAPAERLPFEDASFDSVVATLVFCSVEDPRAVAGEVRRVLKPGGRLLYLEHVRDPNEGGLARWQDRLERPWGLVMGGCHPNRATERVLAEAGFETDPRRDSFPKGFFFIRPVVLGTASLPG
jgi:ubiquinone/menaquinone biosynthesis C-methylase UbiE